MVVALTLALLAAMPIPAQACVCAPRAAVPPQQAHPVSFDADVAIFSETVVERSLLKRTITLNVRQVWKGELTYLITMRISVGMNASSCSTWARPT